MTIRNDIYTMYKGKEYRILYHDGMAKLVSKNAEDLEKGFVEKVYDTKQFKYTPKQLAEKIYTLIVPPNEIGDVYAIVTVVIYQGYEFPIIHEESNGMYVLRSGCTITMPLKLLNQLGFSQVDKGVFEKKIKPEEADLIFEKKTLMTDFFD